MLEVRPCLHKVGIASLCVLAILLCTGASAVLYMRHPPSLLETANKLGPAADALVHGRGLAVCYGPATTESCFHAQRMPLAPAVLGTLYLLFGEHGSLAALVKALLCFAPAFAIIVFVCGRAKLASKQRRKSVSVVLLLAAILPPTLDLIANLNFEEAYFYGWLALSVGLLLFPETSIRRPLLWSAFVCVAAGLCYLTKSSLLMAASFLVIMAAIYATYRLCRTRLAILLICGFACATLLWGLWQHRSSGRFTAGTSLDGVNLYKGNNPLFLQHYPAFRGASVDADEAALFAGRVSDEEWDQNDFGLRSAYEYIRTHPALTAKADLRKASVFFLGVELNDDDEAHGQLLTLAFIAGMAVFRLMLVAAVGIALVQAFASGGDRFPAIVFLGLAACVAAPYVAGFALTRHATVLLLPSALYLCRVLLPAEALSRKDVQSEPGQNEASMQEITPQTAVL